MKRRKTVWMLAACMGVLLISGCGGEQQKIFSQAEEDLEQGNYAAFSSPAEILPRALS